MKCGRNKEKLLARKNWTDKYEKKLNVMILRRRTSLRKRPDRKNNNKPWYHIVGQASQKKMNSGGKNRGKWTGPNKGSKRTTSKWIVR